MHYYGFTDPNPSTIELDNRLLARKAAEEGIVLLKNENVLPLKNKKIALYGVGARHTENCGLGSGSLDSRHNVSIEEGLKNLNYEITTQKWLNDYDNEYKASYQAFRDMVESKLVGLFNPVDVIGTARSYVFRYPSGKLVTEEDIHGSNTDTAIFVLTRQAGEGNDRKLEKGDYYITDDELENLKIISKSYLHTILIINVGGIIDLAFLEEVTNINAIIHYVQAGEEGGNALANLLSGQNNFSGKLADTIPLHYEDIPFGSEYGYLNGNLKDEYYKEGIYVGYRYYDSFHKEVRYPFGYGLSYTTFEIDTTDVKINSHFITLSEKVTNTGKVAGKEVVQVYVSVPGENKEYQRLIEFHKTKNINPNEAEMFDITFDFADCSSYCEKEACWKLDSGLYYIRVGNSSRTTSIVAKIELSANVVTVQCKNCCKCVDKFEELSTSSEQNQHQKNSSKLFELKFNLNSIVTEKVNYSEAKVKETEEEKSFLDKLTVEEQIELLIGGDLMHVQQGALDILSAAGKTTMNLISKGLRNIVFADGPAGLSILNEVCFKNGSENSVPVTVPESYNWGEFAKYMKSNICSSDGTLVYRYTTDWPVEVLLAQTWNREILTEMGIGLSKEMEKYGISVFLGPGMNIHRNPLCGRTFEYYSEDPLLMGTMASSLINGIQNNKKKTGVAMKHFCCNNTEDDRKHSSSNVSERALREIYLKGFEIAVKKSSPKTIMSSYNLLNHVYTPNNKDLLVEILRCEWRFDGLVMTDWDSCGKTEAAPEVCPLAGNDLIMPGQEWCKMQVINAYKEGKIPKENIRIAACRVLRLILNGVTEARLSNFK